MDSALIVVGALVVGLEVLGLLRHRSLAKRLEMLISETRVLERQLAQLKADLPTTYAPRLDWIRFSNTLETKVDAMHRRFDRLMEYLRKHLGD